MKLKRHYKRGTGPDVGQPQKGGDVWKPKLSHIEIVHTGVTAAQRFSVKLVAASMDEGWMSVQDGMLTLRAVQEDLKYTILRMPGKYVSATDPSVHETIYYYDCVLDAAQHRRYCVDKKEGSHG